VRRGEVGKRQVAVVIGCAVSTAACAAESAEEETEGAANNEQAATILSVVQGALLFDKGFPGTGGNGRTCSTCHNPDDAFQLRPENVERRWQKLQAAKALNPNADDPLFRSIDANDGANDFTNLRRHALVRARHQRRRRHRRLLQHQHHSAPKGRSLRQRRVERDPGRRKLRRRQRRAGDQRGGRHRRLIAARRCHDNKRRTGDSSSVRPSATSEWATALVHYYHDRPL
jgi:hypothetical protein